MYQRADFPAIVNYDSRVKKLQWKISFEELDFHYYLPLFFTGLVETEDPPRFIVSAGIRDMLANGSSRIIPIIPQLVLPIKGKFSACWISLLMFRCTEG